MNKRSILSYAVFFGGMALLIACLSIWKGEDTPTNVFVLNLIISVKITHSYKNTNMFYNYFDIAYVNKKKSAALLFCVLFCK